MIMAISWAQGLKASTGQGSQARTWVCAGAASYDPRSCAVRLALPMLPAAWCLGATSAAKWLNTQAQASRVQSSQSLVRQACCGSTRCLQADIRLFEFATVWAASMKTWAGHLRMRCCAKPRMHCHTLAISIHITPGCAWRALEVILPANHITTATFGACCSHSNAPTAGESPSPWLSVSSAHLVPEQQDAVLSSRSA